MNLVIPEKLAPKRRRPWLPRAWRTPLAVVGTVIALMLPYVMAIAVVWLALLVVWQLLGLPWGI